MTAHESAPDRLLGALEQWAGDIEVYLFGSWLQDPVAARDIDVLFVYPDGQLSYATRLAASLRDLAHVPTYDVIVLSEAEEDELSFVKGAHAVRIWPPR